MVPVFTFETHTHGVYRTNGPTLGTVNLDGDISPGQKISWNEENDEGTKFKFQGVVSQTGCAVEGSWEGDGKSGTETLFWIEPREFWVKR